MNWILFLADVLVFFHLLYILYVVLGEVAILAGYVRRWAFIRNLWFRGTHLAAIGYVGYLALANKPCPLTVWEYQLREAGGGLASWELSFMARIFQALVYYDFPGCFFTVLHVGFLFLVIFTLILIPPRVKRN